MSTTVKINPHLVDGDFCCRSRPAAAGRHGDEGMMVDKVGYVLRQRQSRDHTCHWPGCEKQVPPAMWGCKEHWYALPKALRDEVWQTYRPGQEKTLTPSRAYVEAARKVQNWITSQQGQPKLL